MKCLSVSQPFADLIVVGKKTVELRSWNTNFRGEFLVHAPLNVRREDAKRLHMDKEFVTGAIIGKVEIFGVKRYNTAKELNKDYKYHLASKKFQDRRYGFLLRGAKALNIPIPYKGRLGFFEASFPKAKIKDSEILAEIIDEEYRYQWVGHH